MAVFFRRLPVFDDVIDGLQQASLNAGKVGLDEVDEAFRQYFRYAANLGQI